MKLTKVHITEFQSIQDSNEFKIGDVTCLVGKNEAGKTALLKALYRLNPIIESEGDFDAVNDYPRRNVADYQEEVDARRREPAQVVQAAYTFEVDDTAAVEKVFGPACLKDKKPTVTLQKGYSNRRTFSNLRVDDKAIIKHLVKAAGLSQPLADDLLKKETAMEMVESSRRCGTDRSCTETHANASEHIRARRLICDLQRYHQTPHPQISLLR